MVLHDFSLILLVQKLFEVKIEDVVTRVERGKLRWFDLLERMNDSRLTKQIYRANMRDGKVGEGRPGKPYAEHIGSILKLFNIAIARPRLIIAFIICQILECKVSQFDRSSNHGVMRFRANVFRKPLLFGKVSLFIAVLKVSRIMELTPTAFSSPKNKHNGQRRVFREKEYQ
ncbi:hypothetical protein EVAR_50112_1 [Eumeta japonica]|uniref:Uncharacterized protein n=1 Tax=Eumeta variegata TaxID=151549 RepID=A0A4C1XUM1_EUMVA|nr:hypothetical protein EVAR_50112_1 [Eumeta japonica]